MESILHTLHLTPGVVAANITGFIILVLILSRFLFRPVLSLLDAREHEVRSNYEGVINELNRAEQLRAGYENQLAGIEAEARVRLQTAVKEAQDAKGEIIADARNRSEGILRRGQEDLVREREKTLAQIREEVVNISLAAASRVIGETLDSERHRSLIRESIDKIGTSQ